jgi:putative membrane protein
VQQPDERFADAVEAAVAEIEAHTSAEIVVVVAPRSDHFRDVSIAGGALVAWIALAFLLFSPLQFSAWSAALEAPLIGAVAAAWLHRSPSLLRRLASTQRLRTAAERAAAATFQNEAVHCTRSRTGILIYVSVLEDRVVLLADTGLDALVPNGAWNAIRWGTRTDPRAPGDTAQFIAGLRALGAVLAAHLPSTTDNPNEMSDRPRMLS